MKRRKPSDGEGRLRRRLRDEAESSRPAFCEATYDRLRRAVHDGAARAADEAPEPAASAASPRIAPRASLAVALVAAAAVCLVVAGATAFRTWRAGRDEPPGEPSPPVVAHHQPDADPVEQPDAGPVETDFAVFPMLPSADPSTLLAAVERRVASTPWEYLDHDARVILAWTAETLPTPPGWPPFE